MSFISGLRPDGKASARQWTGWTARVNTGDGAAWRRLAPGSSAWCTRGAAGAQVRLFKWAAEPASSTGSATMKPTGRIRDRRPTRRIVAAVGLWHPIATCPDGQPGEWSPRGRSRSPCMGVAQIRGRSHGAILPAVFILATGHTTFCAPFWRGAKTKTKVPSCPPTPTLLLARISFCSQTRRSGPPPHWAVLPSHE
jgi:hypothetical protein